MIQIHDLRKNYGGRPVLSGLDMEVRKGEIYGLIGRIGAVKAGNYLYFQPIVTLIFGYLVLHQAMSIVGLAGCVLTIFGVYCGERLSQERRRLHH